MSVFTPHVALSIAMLAADIHVQPHPGGGDHPDGGSTRCTRYR